MSQLTDKCALIIWLFGAALITLTFSALPSFTQSFATPLAQEKTPLLADQPMERSLSPGEKHFHGLALKAGQCVKLEIEQQGVDVVVQLYSPDGVQPPQADAEPWGHGKEVILWEAAVTGTYRVEVHAWRSTAGRYAIRWSEIPTPTQWEQALLRANRLCAQAIHHLQNGKHDEGVKLAEESLALHESVLPPDDPAIAEGLYWLISLLESRGNFDDVERIAKLYERGLHIKERAFGLDHPLVARWLNDMANGCELVRAIQLFERGATILENQYGPDHPDLGLLLSNYAIKLDDHGDFERAEAMYKRAAAIRERAIGPDDSNLAQSLSNLGDFYTVRGDYERAEPLLQRALAIWTKVHGRQHERTTFAIGNLADLYRRKGDFTRAEPLAREVLEILQKISGSAGLMVGGARHSLGQIYLEMGDFTRAEQSLQQTQPFLDRHPAVFSNLAAIFLRTRTRLSLAMGRNEEAIAFLKHAVGISESRLNTVLAFGSEQEKLNFLNAFNEETNEALSLHAHSAPGNAQALELAFTIWLQRKGRALDEMNRSIGMLRLSAGNEAAPLFNQLMTKQSQLSRLATSEPNEQIPDDPSGKLQQLTREIAALQSAISARSAEFRTQVLPPVTIGDVRTALPKDSALVEFARYQPEDARTKKTSAPRYLAYVLPKEGSLRWVELGGTAEIDAAIRAFRQTLIDQGGLNGPRSAARLLDKLVMQPVRSLLGPARQVFLSPEGALNLVPFAALRNERGRYLVEDYLFVYLTSGRDLLRLRIKHKGNDEVLVFAAPDYNDGAANDAAPNRSPVAAPDDRAGRVSRGAYAFAPFKALPYARVEAEAIKRNFPQARLLLGAAATESAVKQLHRPSVLHIITHGVFLDNQLSGTDERPQRMENPLLRSWLVLAGANQRRSGAEDGILTAYEAAALDLWGTKLVVLSACETGIGKVTNGEGVYGLRRALVLAGAETQLTSLWKVDDRVTKNLMQSYYKKLRDGAGRMEALRQVQLEMLKSKGTNQPYYWASFIALGEWANLEGRR